jgi:hypothetical protein
VGSRCFSAAPSAGAGGDDEDSPIAAMASIAQRVGLGRWEEEKGEGEGANLEERRV